MNPSSELEQLRNALGEAQAALSLERENRLSAQAALRLNEERLNALLGLSERTSCSERELNDYVLDESVRLTSSRLGYLHFVNASESGFDSYVWSKGAAELCGTSQSSMDFSLATAGIWADSLRFRQPAVHNDYTAAPGRRGLPEGHLSIMRLMSVPIFKDGKVVAVLGVANKPEPYDEADLRQLLLFGNRLWGILEAKRIERDLASANETLRRLAVQDSLTGLANRRRFEEFFAQFWEAGRELTTSVAVLMLDIDFFKPYNDSYGHQAGDEALRLLGGLLSDKTRGMEALAARYGGEEFVLVLPGIGEEEAELFARRLLESVRSLGIEHGSSGVESVLTVSIGVAAAPSAAELSPAELLRAADDALYRAKRSGRNRAALARPGAGSPLC